MKLPLELHTLGETLVTVGAEYDAGGNIPRRLGSLVDPGFLLERSHEARAHQRVRAVNPDQAHGPWTILRLTHHIRGPRGRVGMEDPPRPTLLLLRPPFVGPESGQKLLVSA